MEETSSRRSHSFRQCFKSAVIGGLVGAAGLVPTMGLGGPRLERIADSPPPPSPVPPRDGPPVSLSPHPPSVVFLLDDQESMQDFPVPLGEYAENDPDLAKRPITPGFSAPRQTTRPGAPGWVGKEGEFTDTGCSDPRLVAAMSWFDKNSPDPAKNGSVVYDSDPDLSSPYFEKGKFYQTRSRRIGWQTEDYPYSVGAFFNAMRTFTGAQDACYTMVNYNTNDYQNPGSTALMDECQACLATKGWWRGPRIEATTDGSYNDDDFPPEVKTHTAVGDPPTPDTAYRKWIVSGGVLNLRPPKFVVARKVIKDVIQNAQFVRMGVATYGDDHGWFDPPNLLKPLRPGCDLSSPINEAALDRGSLARAVNAVRYRNNEHSAGEAVFGLGGYFSSQRVDARWEGWFKQNINPGYFGWPGCCNGGTLDNPITGQGGLTYAAAPDEWLKPGFQDPSSGEYRPGQPWEGTGSDKSVCFDDQISSVILITDSTPRYDNSVPITKMMQLLKAQGARHPDGSLVQFDPTDPASNPNVGGINYCDQFEKDPVTHQKYTKADCDYDSSQYNWPTGLGVGNKNFMDDVTFFLSHTDLRGDLPGSQTVRTSVVGYRTSSPMLQSMALAGQGQFRRADTASELRTALEAILASLNPSPMLPP